jgi:hypothetical protein
MPALAEHHDWAHIVAITDVYYWEPEDADVVRKW